MRLLNPFSYKYECMTNIMKLLMEVGIPIGSAIIMGFFIFLTLKYILDSVGGSVTGLTNIMNGLESRVRQMNNDMIKIDLLVSESLDLRPDIDRVARNENFVEDGKIDSRSCLLYTSPSPRDRG